MGRFAAGVLNETAGTITLPIYYGVVEDPETFSSEKGSESSEGKSMFYVVTDTSDEANAAALGLNHSPKLQYANVGRASRKAYLDQDLVRSTPPKHFFVSTITPPFPWMLVALS